MLTVLTWLWGDKFGVDDVAKLAAGVGRNLKQDYRLICMVDRLRGREPIEGVEYRQILIPDLHLTAIKGCYVRLRMFDPHWQFLCGIEPGERIACLDLDTVITGPLDPLFDRPEPYLIMQGGNATNPCKFNGAMMMLRAGAYPEICSDFSVEAASKVPFFEFPDDQGWIWAKIPNAAGWKCGPESGVYVFLKPGWPKWSHDLGSMKHDLPKDARLVTFSGWRSPKKFSQLDWVKKNWVA